ncbi:MAG TPA: methyl-accepting chemotaxis protein [Moraxellaceae bacterium]|nr:methyl-accepting chemotaxis protein [Moraxellaceae bacterium]
MNSNLQTVRDKLSNLRGIDWKRVFSKESFRNLIPQGTADTAAQTKPWMIGLGASLAVLVIAFMFVFVKSYRATAMINNASELRVLSQDIAKNASEAAGGNPAAFEQLKQSREHFQTAWDELVSYRGKNDAQIQSLDKVWNPVSSNAKIVLDGSKSVLQLHELAQTLTETVPDLQAEYDIVVEGMLRTGASATQISIAKQQSVLAERILRSVNKVLQGGADAVTSADSFGRDAAQFERVLKGMLAGDEALGVKQVTDPEAQDALAAIADSFDSSVKQSANAILETSPELFQVRAAADSIFRDSRSLLDASTALSVGVAQTADTSIYTFVGIIALLVGLLCAAKLYSIRANQDRIAAEHDRQAEAERAEQIESENRRNQDAILRLLDELGDLADGDLTVQATVTEDFTGAIADSINYSIDQLRGLVATINSTAVQVSAAAQETQSTAMHLAEASEHQAQEIAGASAAVNEMAVSIDQVSANAAESAAVAERSVAIAHKGAEVVQNTISGMDTIREQIQETSKRIKRLGESSQEIGDIVSLINDIADQTNILALNAAIQASMAGEAGRGFAVVADEVQRLAERSAAATKQIEQLVKTIQTDTNEAVISMEQTTAEVVRGARLAQDAGVALGEIENVSRTLADLIQNISNAARQQAASAGHISNTMNVIQEITSQTTAGTIATARSIGNLAEMANELRHSVAGFKLPEHA